MGRDNTFKDVDSIPLGWDFRRILQEAVTRCDVLLAVIGPRWLCETDAAGRRRVDDPEDWVRIEIETALERAIPVIPLLVDGASFPRGEDLPPSLQGLVYRHGTPVRPDPDFRHDMGRVIKALREIEPGVSSNQSQVRARQPAQSEKPAPESVPPPPRPERRPPGRFWPLVASVAVFATLPVVADLVFLAGPPWPARLKTTLLTTLVACTVLPGAYAWQRSSPQERLRSRTIVFGALAACLVLTYLALTSAFVYDAPDAMNQEAGGFLVKRDVSKVMAKNPSMTLGDLLQGAEYVPDKVWVPWTVAVVRLALVTSWIGIFGLAAAAGACVLRAEWATGPIATHPPTTPTCRDAVRAEDKSIAASSTAAGI